MNDAQDLNAIRSRLIDHQVFAKPADRSEPEARQGRRRQVVRRTEVRPRGLARRDAVKRSTEAIGQVGIRPTHEIVEPNQVQPGQGMESDRGH
jgi:hypothetical protein